MRFMEAAYYLGGPISVVQLKNFVELASHLGLEHIELPEAIEAHLSRNFVSLNMTIGIDTKAQFIGLSSDGFDTDFEQIDKYLVDNQIEFVKLIFPEAKENDNDEQVVLLHDGDVGVYNRGKTNIEYLASRLSGPEIHRLNVLLQQYDSAEVTLSELLNRLEADFAFPVRLSAVTLED